MDLIVCYDPLEIDVLKARLTAAVEVEVPGSRFPATTGRFQGRTVAVIRLPFGNDPALLLRVLGAAIERFAPSAILSLGTAMALDAAVETGDLFLTGTARCGDAEASFTPALIELARRAARAGTPVRIARGLTVDTFVEGCPDAPGFDLVEMEDHWIAREAASRGIPALSIRAITDHGSFADHMANRARAIVPALRLLERFFWRRRMEELVVERKNPSTQDLPFRMVVRAAGALSLPAAVGIARAATRDFSLNSALTPDARLEIEALPAASWSAAPAGWERVDSRGTGRFFRSPDRSAGLVQVPAAATGPVRLETAEVSWPAPERVHLQGISTVSAEPEEGLLAAITLDELEAARMDVVDSLVASHWVYRTGDKRENDYFELPEGYVYPHRSSPEIPHGVKRVVTGLGPAIDPGSTGGESADVLMLGDEMGGRLLLLLDDLAGRAPSDEIAFRHPGIVLRLDGSRVALSRIDLRPALRDQALDKLAFKPASLRRIYPKMVNERLSEYFSADIDVAPERSYLLMSSRGCGLKCSICCSGGFQKFQALSAQTFVSLLEEIAAAHAGEPGKIQIHLLDSYFNLQPGRVERIAQLMEEKGLTDRFQLHLRHSGLRTFLRGGSSDGPANVHRDLIRAYRRLGLTEVVMGIDAYTDRAIQVLKTDVDKLARGGATTAPAYRFDDIRAVLAALEAEGLESRGFLLLNNPFLDDAGRIETFYNLVQLALEVPGFMIDASSSSAVNELKPFPGAPLTEVASRIPGLIQGDRFVFRTELGRLDERLDFSAFGQRRRKPEDLARFARRVQASRATLSRVLLHHFREGGVGRRASHESLDAAMRWIDEEEKLSTEHRAFFLEHGDPRAEWALATARSLLQRRLRRMVDSPLRPGVDRHAMLFEELAAMKTTTETDTPPTAAGALQVLRS